MQLQAYITQTWIIKFRSDLACSEEQFVLAKLILVLIFYQFCNNISAGRSEIVSSDVLRPTKDSIAGIKIVVGPPTDKKISMKTKRKWMNSLNHSWIFITQSFIPLYRNFTRANIPRTEKQCNKTSCQFVSFWNYSHLDGYPAALIRTVSRTPQARSCWTASGIRSF